MRYRPLGRTGLTVSEVGFGAWGIGGDVNGSVAYGPTDDAESLRALRRAFDRGVTFYDTAAFYGYGHSERLIGTAFREVREHVVLATKAGILDKTGRGDFSCRHVRESLEASLRRLQTDYVDLFQLHSPPPEVLADGDELFALLDRLNTDGKVRAVGVSLRSPEEGRAALERFAFGCVQVNFSLIDQRALGVGLFEHCAASQVGVIVRTPLCFGFLTTRYTERSGFSESDHRRRWSPEQIRRWAESYEQFAPALNGCAEQTPAQAALRYCLSYPAVSTVIPGMLTPAHVEENVASSDLPTLDESELALAEQTYRENCFFQS